MQKPAKFIPQNKLEKLLVKAAKKNSLRDKFFAELSKSDVYIVPLNRPSIREGKAAVGEKMQLLGYKHNHVFFIAFFSSEERVAEANVEGMGYLRLAAKDLFKMTKGSYLVLNPNSAYGKEFFPNEINEMMKWDDNKNIAYL